MSVIYLFLLQMLLLYSMKERGIHSRKQKNISMIVIILFSIMAVIKFIIYVIYNRNKMTQADFNGSFYNILF